MSFSLNLDQKKHLADLLTDLAKGILLGIFGNYVILRKYFGFIQGVALITFVVAALLLIRYSLKLLGKTKKKG